MDEDDERVRLIGEIVESYTFTTTEAEDALAEAAAEPWQWIGRKTYRPDGSWFYLYSRKDAE